MWIRPATVDWPGRACHVTTMTAIIANVRMPEADGTALYRQLSKSHPTLSKLVIYCTEDIAHVTIRRFLNGTGARAIRRPFAVCTVLNVVSWKLRAVHSPACFSSIECTTPSM